MLGKKGNMAITTDLSESDVSTRNRLLKAAQDEILDAGFFAASVDRIAHRANASKQTLYAYFQSREQLFQDVLRMTVEEASEPDAPDVRLLGFEEALRAYARWVEASSLKPANLEMYRANIAAAAVFPELAAQLHSLRLRPTWLVSVLQNAQQYGKLADLPVERLVNWFGVLAIGGLRQLLGFHPTPAERQQRVDGLVQLFLGGWRQAAEPARPANLEGLPVALPVASPIDNGGRLSVARWQQLLRVAVRNFTKAGFRRSSVDQIATEAGISKMTVYKRYGNKGGLFSAALDQAVDDLAAERPRFCFSTDIRASLVASALEQDRFAQEKRYVQLLRLFVAEAPTHLEIVQRAWTRLVTPGQVEFAAQLQEWRGAGEFQVANCAMAAEQFLLLAGRGNLRLTDTIAWDEEEAIGHARSVAALVYP